MQAARGGRANNDDEASVRGDPTEKISREGRMRRLPNWEVTRRTRHNVASQGQFNREEVSRGGDKAGLTRSDIYGSAGGSRGAEPTTTIRPPSGLIQPGRDLKGRSHTTFAQLGGDEADSP